MWRPLPPGWEEFHDKKTHRSYYVNKTNGLKTWTRPVDIDSSEVNDAAGVLEGVEAGACEDSPEAARVSRRHSAATSAAVTVPDAVAVTENRAPVPDGADAAGRK